MLGHTVRVLETTNNVLGGGLHEACGHKLPISHLNGVARKGDMEEVHRILPINISKFAFPLSPSLH